MGTTPDKWLASESDFKKIIRLDREPNRKLAKEWNMHFIGQPISPASEPLRTSHMEGLTSPAKTYPCKTNRNEFYTFISKSNLNDQNVPLSSFKEGGNSCPTWFFFSTFQKFVWSLFLTENT